MGCWHAHGNILKITGMLALSAGMLAHTISVHQIDDSDFEYVANLPGAAKKTAPYKNLTIFRIIQYFLLKFSEVIRETFSH